MSPSKAELSSVKVAVKNIGGIDEAHVELTQGVTVLAGRNATNRTSFLQAIMAGLGSNQISLKGDADEGFVELTMGNETYSRTVTRSNGSIVTGGAPYLDGPELADLFAFLLESNEPRQAIARGDDLRDLIMRPVDAKAIQDEIERLEHEKRNIDETLNRIDSQKRKLSRLMEERKRLRSNIEEKKTERDKKEKEIEHVDANVEESRQEKIALQKKLEEVQQARSSLDDVRFNLETERESLVALEDERATLSEELEELIGEPMDEPSVLEQNIANLREHRQELDKTITQLQSLISFNEEILEGETDIALFQEKDRIDTTDESITDQLITDTTKVFCWTCGSDVGKRQIEGTIDNLRRFRSKTLTQRNKIQNELDQLSDRQRKISRKQDRLEKLQRKLERTKKEIRSRKSNVEELESKHDEYTERIHKLESQVNELEREEYSEILELHREANQLGFELDRMQNRLADVDDRLAELQEHVENRDTLEERRADVNADLSELRTRIDHIEEQAVTQFNEHMEVILEKLEYKNIERIWIERIDRIEHEGSQQHGKSTFNLHVVRSSDTGTTYEDTVDHLSESEREITGLVFALAGYLVHELYETIPFMLLDSLEAIDANRIATLIDHFSEYADYLVVALLPEDAAALDHRIQRISNI